MRGGSSPAPSQPHRTVPGPCPGMPAQGWWQGQSRGAGGWRSRGVQHCCPACSPPKGPGVGPRVPSCSPSPKQGSGSIFTVPHPTPPTVLWGHRRTCGGLVVGRRGPALPPPHSWQVHAVGQALTPPSFGTPPSQQHILHPPRPESSGSHQGPDVGWAVPWGPMGQIHLIPTNRDPRRRPAGASGNCRWPLQLRYGGPSSPGKQHTGGAGFGPFPSSWHEATSCRSSSGSHSHSAPTSRAGGQRQGMSLSTQPGIAGALGRHPVLGDRVVQLLNREAARAVPIAPVQAGPTEAGMVPAELRCRSGQVGRGVKTRERGVVTFS